MRIAAKQTTKILAAFLATVITGHALPPAATNYAQDRAERAKALTVPYGWFSLIALNWLKPGITTVGSAKDNSIVLAAAPAHLMTLEQKDGRVTLLAADPSLVLPGNAAAAFHPVIADDDEGDKGAMQSGTLHMWAINRGNQRYLRVMDSQSPALKHFHGLNWYAPNPHYVVEARWIPYSTPHTLKVVNKLGQTSMIPVPGYAEFELDGKKLSLIPMPDGDGLEFVFKDLTARETTDGGGRFLDTALPSAGLNKPGKLLLDFNEAVNPPCAYTPYATCPLASPENRLPIAVPAGEKRYED